MILNLEFRAKSQIEMGLEAEPVLCAIWISLNDHKLGFFCAKSQIETGLKAETVLCLFGLV
jgi:hypothetical protein